MADFSHNWPEGLTHYPASESRALGTQHKEGEAWIPAPTLQQAPGLTSYTQKHDQCNSLAVAYTAYLHTFGETETVGLTEEVCRVLPKSADLN